MKLDYKILWLDDKIDVIIEGEYDIEIKDHLIEQGFNPIIITVKNETEFFRILDDTFDLILTDYHLNFTADNTRDGDEIIKQVRQNSIFTEIMFYSAQGEVITDIKLDRITFLDTRKSIIRDHNEAVKDNAIKLIDLTIRKFQHIVAMRGMIMHETSSIDSEMLDIVKGYIDKTNSREVKNRIFDELIRFHNEKLKKSNKFKENDNINSVLNDPILISSNQRANAIEEIIKLIGFDNFIEQLKTDVIKVRNEFAHALYKKDKATGREYFQGKQGETEFNESKCKEIRINIAKHKKNIEELKDKLRLNLEANDMHSEG